MTEIYFASHQYNNNFFECNQFNLTCLKRWFTGTRDSFLRKPQYFLLNGEESEHPESSCAEGVYQKNQKMYQN